MAAFVFIGDKNFKPKSMGWNTAVDFNAGSLPEDPKVIAQIQTSLKGRLLAWDPVAAESRSGLCRTTPPGMAAWSRPRATWSFRARAWASSPPSRPTTASACGRPRHTPGILAPPITYEANGEQYVAVEVGWGGAFGLAAGQLAHDAQANRRQHPARAGVQAERHGHACPSLRRRPIRHLRRRLTRRAPRSLPQGKLHYHTFCSMCHGDSAFSGGVLPGPALFGRARRSRCVASDRSRWRPRRRTAWSRSAAR